VLRATRHKWTHPTLTPVRQASIRFTYPGGMEGWVDLVDFIAPRLWVEPATFWSRVQRSTTAPSRQYPIQSSMSMHHYECVETIWVIYIVILNTLCDEYFSLFYQEFCLFAVLGLGSDFFLQMFFFTTVLSIDIRRMEVCSQLKLPSFVVFFSVVNLIW